MNYITLTLAVLNIVFLSFNYMAYRIFRERQVSHLNKCLNFIQLSILQGGLAFINLFPLNTRNLIFQTSILFVISLLLNIFLIEILYNMIGKKAVSFIPFRKLCVLFALIGGILALTNQKHHLLIQSVERKQDTFSYLVKYGSASQVLSTIVSIFIFVMLFKLLFSIDTSRYGNKRIFLILMASVFIITLIQWAENLIEFRYSVNYHFSYFALWIPVSTICYIYFGHLWTSRYMAVRNMQEMYIVFDKEGRLVDANPFGSNFFLDYCGTSYPSFAQFLELLELKERTYLEEYEFKLSGGKEVRYFIANTFNISDSISQYSGDGFIIRDITEYKEKLERLNRLAVEDPLTGVKNRRYLFEHSNDILKKAVDKNEPITVLMLDIDHFKRINDTYGHMAGDDVLKIFCERCMKILTEQEMMFRYGGEEFIILAENCGTQQGQELAKRILATVNERPFALSDSSALITVSIGGCTMYAEQGGRIEQWIETADENLYLAKNNGRNRIEYFSDKN